MSSVSDSVVDEVMAGKGLRLGDAAKMFPRPNGRGISACVMWRYRTVGAMGANGHRVKLECCKVGSLWFTTEAAIRRFIEALSTSEKPEATPPRSPGDRKRKSAAASKELDRLGV